MRRMARHHIIAQGLFQGGKKVLEADFYILRKFGWKPGAARGISHGLAGGTFLTQQGFEQPDGLSPSNAPPTSSVDQTYSRSKSNGYKNNSGIYTVYRKLYLID